MSDIDVLIVGSGPAGAQAAAAAVDTGLRVVVVDVGELDLSVGEAIPAGSFSDLRRGDPDQWRYFIGDISESSVVDVKAGAQLTPPRRYLTQRVDELAPLQSKTFRPMLSLAKGGLGGGWGAGCETFSAAECSRAGLDYEAIRAGYDDVAADIGISGSATGDIAQSMAQLSPLQPAAPIDDNAASLLATYERRRAHFRAKGFNLGLPPIALLTERIERDGYIREPNPLDDLDFYRDAERSIYRPRFTIERLSGRANFRYEAGLLALRFEAGARDGVRLTCRDLASNGYRVIEARRVILAAGALNTPRIVTRSFDAYGARLPLICNPYRYIPAINLSMLGRPVADRRHSMAQLAASYSAVAGDPEQMFIAFYSYRSLLLHKLVKEMPLPVNVGLFATRIMLSSLTVLGAHFSDSAAPGKWIALERAASPEADILHAEYVQTASEKRVLRHGIGNTLRMMVDLRLIPLGVIDAGFGASIHYAGALSTADTLDPHAVRSDGALVHAPTVFVADSSAWSFLPAKGPTLTIMAHARNVAATVARELGREIPRT